MSKPSRPLAKAKQFIVENPFATTIEVISGAQVSRGTVIAARRALVAEGGIPLPTKDRKSAAFKAAAQSSSPEDVIAASVSETPFEVETGAALAAAVRDIASGLDDTPPREQESEDEKAIAPDTSSMDVNELKAALTRIIRRAKDDRIKTNAIWTLSRIQQEMQDRPLGPGTPQTEAQVIARLIDLFEGVGRTLLAKALIVFQERGGYGKVPAVDSSIAEPAHASSAGISDNATGVREVQGLGNSSAGTV